MNRKLRYSTADIPPTMVKRSTLATKPVYKKPPLSRKSSIPYFSQALKRKKSEILAQSNNLQGVELKKSAFESYKPPESVQE